MPSAVVPIPAPTSPHGTAITSMMVVLCVLGIAAVIQLGVLIPKVSQSAAQTPTIIIGADAATGMGAVQPEGGSELVPDTVMTFSNGVNVCAGRKPDIPNVDCVIDGMTNVGPQSGANVTRGFMGLLNVDHEPITTPYWQNGLCPVNVHWHLGAEHYSVGQYDENGKGIREIEMTTDGGTSSDFGSFQCHHYDPADPKFTKPYDWKHCIGMEVGQTYEVHWPHSKAGACGTPNQYQTPFYDGVFCNLPAEDIPTLTAQDIAYSVGVQAQVFTSSTTSLTLFPTLCVA